jgi:hypothetical protein
MEQNHISKVKTGSSITITEACNDTDAGKDMLTHQDKNDSLSTSLETLDIEASQLPEVFTLERYGDALGLVKWACFIVWKNTKLFSGEEPNTTTHNRLNDLVSELSHIFAYLISKDKVMRVQLPFYTKTPDCTRTIFKWSISSIPLAEVVKRIGRGLEIAKDCTICAKIDPVAGAMIHVTSVLLQYFMTETSSIDPVWKKAYENSASTSSSPQIEGAYDMIIETARLNFQRFPNLYQFFNTRRNSNDGTFFMRTLKTYGAQ